MKAELSSNCLLGLFAWLVVVFPLPEKKSIQQELVKSDGGLIPFPIVACN